MSISTYSSQVNSLTSDLASLRSKLASERKRLAAANAKSARAMEALSKASSSSQVGSKAREVERCQKAAAALEKKTAELETSIAQKQKRLSSAQANLERAQRAQQKEADKDAERRRKADIDHIRMMDRERRATTPLPERLVARPQLAPGSSSGPPQFTDSYDVCLSFAGEQRDYVELIATELKKAKLAVFYDRDEEILPRLWGKDLGDYLDYIYRQGSRFCLMFISADYAEKAWTTHERRSAFARVLAEGGEYVLPVRFDDTELPGLRPTTAYVDLREIAPLTLVDFVLRKLRTPMDEGMAGQESPNGSPVPVRVPGRLRGQIEVGPEFNELDDEMGDLFGIGR